VQHANHYANQINATSRQFSQADKNETTHITALQTEIAPRIVTPSTTTNNRQKEETEEKVRVIYMVTIKITKSDRCRYQLLLLLKNKV